MPENGMLQYGGAGWGDEGKARGCGVGYYTIGRRTHCRLRPRSLTDHTHNVDFYPNFPSTACSLQAKFSVLVTNLVL